MNNQWFNLGQPTPSGENAFDLNIPLWPNKQGCNGQSDGWYSGIPFEQYADGFSDYHRLSLDIDPVIFPGGIRIRNLLGQGGACMTWSTSRAIKIEQLFFNVSGKRFTASGSSVLIPSPAPPRQFDLLSFPIVLNASSPGAITSVALSYGDVPVYSFDNTSVPLNSLTLFLPPSEAWAPWTLTVNGAAGSPFTTGLRNVTVGRPRDELLLVNETWTTSAGLALTLRSRSIADGLAVCSTFYAANQWDADAAAAMNDSTVEPFAANYTPGAKAGLARHVNAGVPRAPVGVHGIALPAGMSGGWFFPNGQDGGAYRLYNTTPAAWATALGRAGLDFVAEQARGVRGTELFPQRVKVRTPLRRPGRHLGPRSAPRADPPTGPRAARRRRQQPRGRLGRVGGQPRGRRCGHRASARHGLRPALPRP